MTTATTSELDEALLQYQGCIAVYEAENELFKVAKQRRCTAWRELVKAEAVYVRTERRHRITPALHAAFAVGTIH